MSEKAVSAIELQDVHLSLGRGAARVHILKGVSVSLADGEATGLVGPSGSGKSTLLMTMAGLERPDSGLVKVAGQDLGALDEDGLAVFRGRHIGIVFQSFHLVPTMTARENVALPLELAGHPDAFTRAEAELRNVGLGHRMDHYPAQLSGGEQQRVAIARAIAKRPAVLLCDEPTGALDSKTGIRVIEALLGVNRQLGTTTLIITHNASIQEVADRVLFFADGRISRIRSNETRRDAAELTW